MRKPVIDISLRSEADIQSCFITALCTLDLLTGTARITAPTDTRFESVEIALKGISRTLVDRMSPASAVPKAQCALHKFLDLRQSDVDGKFPGDKILRAGVPYNIPFNFVIPDRMPVNLCQHKVKSVEVSERHHVLPPSLGDPEVSGSGKTRLDDMAPHMCRIAYSVSVQVIQRRLSDGRETTLAEKLRNLRIVPAIEEQSPLDTSALDDEYCLYATKKIKTSLVGRKLGTVTARINQPRSFMFLATEAKNGSPVTTTSTVMLRFDPSDPDAQPPRLGRLSTKLKASTFYASKPMCEFPSRAKYIFDASQGVYSETLNLNCRNMESVQWTKHEPEAATDAQPVHHDSAISIPSTTASAETSKPFYTAQFIVPNTLPTNKVFAPTFHSCLVSRTYALQLSLNFSSQGRGPHLFNSIDLGVPVQISAAPSAQHLAGRATYIPEFYEQYDEYRVPQSAALPLVHGVSTMMATLDEPPAYAPFPGMDKGPLSIYS